MSRGMKQIIEKARNQLSAVIMSENQLVRCKSAYLRTKRQVTMSTAVHSAIGIQGLIAIVFSCCFPLSSVKYYKNCLLTAD